MLSKPKHSSQAWSLCFNNAKKCDETLLNWGFRDRDIQLPWFFGDGGILVGNPTSGTD